MASRRAGEVIEGLDIETEGAPGVVVRHPGVTLRNCRIRHFSAPAVMCNGQAGFVVSDVATINEGAPASGPGPRFRDYAFAVLNSPDARISRVQMTKPSTGLYVRNSPRANLDQVVCYGTCGPGPAGQLAQIAFSPNSRLTRFFGRWDDTDYPEDGVSIFFSDDCYVGQGRLDGSNAPHGSHVQVEGGNRTLVEDVDSVRAFNLAFCSATHSQGTTYRRCRARNNVYGDLGRGLPSTQPHSYAFASLRYDGTRGTRFEDCTYFDLAAPADLIFGRESCAEAALKPDDFRPREPRELNWPWQ